MPSPPEVGVISPVTGGFYFGATLAGIAARVASAGGRVTVVQTLDAGSTGNELRPAADGLSPVGWDRFDGLLGISWAADEASLRRARAHGLPMVLVSSDLDVDAATVVIDNASGVRRAVEHLLGHGHRSIGFVGSLAQSDMRERYDAYRRAVVELGGTEPVHLVAPDHVESGGLAAVPAVLASRVSAVVASTDRVALGLVDGLQAAGVRVPEDVAVVGFDDVEAGWHADPPLATVRQDFAGLGAHAAGLLLAELAGEPVAHTRHVVDSELVPRRSCGCTGGRTDAAPSRARGAALARELLSLGATSDGPATDDVEAVVLRSVTEGLGEAPSPEVVAAFGGAVVDEMRRADLAPPEALLREALVSTTAALAHVEGLRSRRRIDRLSTSVVEQHAVGMGLLERTGADPSDLQWLSEVSVALGCLGLWRPDEVGRTLEVTGIHDPGSRVRAPLPRVCRVEEFPPRGLTTSADPAAGEVTYVIPVRGASGDHGLLCLVGPVDTEHGTGRATYNSWAALLGVALNQRRLVAEVRRSEERYSLAALATHDGLWDWDVEAATCYYSARFREMLGLHREHAATAGDPHERDVGREGGPEELGAWTGVVHPEDRAALLGALERTVTALQPVELELRVAAPRGGYHWMLCRAVPEGPPGGPARRVVGALSDIHDRKELEEQLRRAALYDAVTGLPNRRLFLDRLGTAIESARRRPEGGFAVAFLDLDRFKEVNDTLGHPAGDQLLRAVGERLRDGLRPGDTAARFGGDEFAVLLDGVRPEEVPVVVARVQDAVSAPLVLAGRTLSVGASIGVTTSADGPRDAEGILRDADLAMYAAKAERRGSVRAFTG